LDLEITAIAEQHCLGGMGAERTSKGGQKESTVTKYRVEKVNVSTILAQIVDVTEWLILSYICQ